MSGNRNSSVVGCVIASSLVGKFILSFYLSTYGFFLPCVVFIFFIFTFLCSLFGSMNHAGLFEEKPVPIRMNLCTVRWGVLMWEQKPKASARFFKCEYLVDKILWIYSSMNIIRLHSWGRLIWAKRNCSIRYLLTTYHIFAYWFPFCWVLTVLTCVHIMSMVKIFFAFLSS